MSASSEVPNQPRWEIARKRAEALTEDSPAPPIPVHEVIETNGAQLVYTGFGEFSDRVSGCCDFANATIFVNAADAWVRQRFTMAHELGHWLLHRDLYRSNSGRYRVLPRFAQPASDDPLEKEANHFAANLLVPARLLRPVRGVSVPRLAQAFGVSELMMGYRLRNA